MPLGGGMRPVRRLDTRAQTPHGCKRHGYVRAKSVLELTFLFLCSAYSCFRWVTVFHGLLRNAWQRRFEASLLPQPEIYKRHAFVIKDNNDRLIVLSDFWFYVSGSTRGRAGAFGVHRSGFFIAAGCLWILTLLLFVAWSARLFVYVCISFDHRA